MICRMHTKNTTHTDKPTPHSLRSKKKTHRQSTQIHEITQARLEKREIQASTLLPPVPINSVTATTATHHAPPQRKKKSAKWWRRWYMKLFKRLGKKKPRVVYSVDGITDPSTTAAPSTTYPPTPTPLQSFLAILSHDFCCCSPSFSSEFYTTPDKGKRRKHGTRKRQSRCYHFHLSKYAHVFKFNRKKRSNKGIITSLFSSSS